MGAREPPRQAAPGFHRGIARRADRETARRRRAGVARGRKELRTIITKCGCNHDDLETKDDLVYRAGYALYDAFETKRKVMELMRQISDDDKQMMRQRSFA